MKKNRRMDKIHPKCYNKNKKNVDKSERINNIMDFKYSDDNKRYHTYNYYLRQKFGGKVIKVSLNGGFTCPNIDGTKGTGGCTYCSSLGSGDFGRACEDIRTQFENVRSALLKKWHGGTMFIPYFQANTNTYAPIERLRALYEEALSLEGAVGLAVATRADAVSEEAADYLAELSHRTYLIVELGLQTVFDETGRRINRCHTYDDFLDGYKRLSERGINICVHLIDGLPGETHVMMLESARRVGLLRPHCIKLHLLHILKGTVMAEEYKRGEVTPLTRDEYVDIVCDQLELIPPETVIQRLTGDGARDSLIAPLWSLKKFEVLNAVDAELARRHSYQGRLFRSE